MTFADWKPTMVWIPSRRRAAARRYIWVFVFGLVWAICAGATPAAAETADVRLQLKWIHQAQFAGNYVADRLGYYRAENLRVAFTAGGPGINVIDSVVSGKTDIGIGASDQLIKARVDGHPVVVLATIFRRNPLVFASPKDRNITHPRQFADKTIRATSNHVLSLRKMLRGIGVADSQYSLVKLPSNVETFISGRADVWAAYLTGLVINLELAGHPVNIVFPEDFGVHIYGDTVFALAAYVEKHPDVVRRFLRATIKGWETAILDPDAAAEIVTGYGSSLDTTVESMKIASSAPLIDTGADCIGWMDKRNWQDIAQSMNDFQIIDGTLDVDGFVATKFMKEICAAK